MKLFLCPNGFTDKQEDDARFCISVLEQSGKYRCSLSESDSVRLYGNNCYAAYSPAESDMIVSLGGDGCVLRAAQIALLFDKPLLGINNGRLGYLCAVRFDEIANFEAALQKCRITNRTLLEVAFGNELHYAVNDVVFAKPNFGSTVDLSVCIVGCREYSVRGDGLIAATPTGSTGYNLSAGGALIEPSVPAIMLTPICAHMSGMPSMVIDDSKQIFVSERNNAADIIADGKKIGKLTSRVSIKKSLAVLKLYSRDVNNATDGIK